MMTATAYGATMEPHQPSDHSTRTELIDLTDFDSSAISTNLVHDRPDPEPDQREDNASPTPTATLTIVRGPGAGHTFTVAGDSVTVVGRDPGCDLVLAHVTVSRRHAEIQPAADGFDLVDSGSLNGSYLNRQAVDTARLSDGDEIQLGTFRLRFHTAAPLHP